MVISSEKSLSFQETLRHENQEGNQDIFFIMKACVHKQQAFWSCIFLKMEDGSNIKFWKDKWIQDMPLYISYEELYK